MQPIVLSNYEDPHITPSEIYRFKGSKATFRWPKKQGYQLGAGGFWNFLWRLGFHPQTSTIANLPNPDKTKILFTDKLQIFNKQTLLGLKHWLEKGGKIIATGAPDAWSPFLPNAHALQTCSFSNPYAGLAYLFGNEKPQLIAPPQWQFLSYQAHCIDKQFCFGNIAAVQGERQTPARAHLQFYPSAPAVIHQDGFYYFNGQPFAAFQAWLQGQEDLSPWLAWRHRLFWLDEWVSAMFDIMVKLKIASPHCERPGIRGLEKTTMILRHDLDFSRDTTFLKEENQNNIAATHAVLKDNNTKFWLNELKKHPHQETAFHYNTGKRSWKRLLHRWLTEKSLTSYLPNHREISGKGLLKQLQWAKHAGIGIETIHRHLCYLIYPELIDALDTVFDSNLKVLGSSSLFRGHVLRWGTDRVEGQQGYLTDWPDAQFPLWYPFKLAHAGKQGKILRGWEMTSLMEIEPYLLIQLLNHPIKYISQNIFTLIFHPAHTHSATFYKNGTHTYFKEILTLLADEKITIIPMAQLFQLTNQSFKIKI